MRPTTNLPLRPANVRDRIVAAAILLCGVVAPQASANEAPDVGGLVVTVVDRPPSGPQVRVSQPLGGKGPTSIRYYPPSPRKVGAGSPNPTDPEGGVFHVRDRDLGQTFTAPADRPFRLDAITLRVGPVAYDSLAGLGTPRMLLQILAVAGKPVVHDNGTTAPGLTVSRGYPGVPEADDYITGETYASLLTVGGGVLPAGLRAGETDPKGPVEHSSGTLLRFEIPAAHRIVLYPGRTYAFMVGFEEPGAERSLALDNYDYLNLRDAPAVLERTGPYPGGHAIRREGSLEHPHTRVAEAFSSNPAASAFPPRTVRLAQQPGTWGRPDVDTYRDLVFWIEGSDVAASAP